MSWILGAFAATSLILWAVPAIDLTVSHSLLAPDGRFGSPVWATFSHDALPWTIGFAMTAVLTILAFNHLRDRSVLGVDIRVATYLVLVLALGAGLVVNTGLKDHFGRARPRDVVEFSGTKRFTPAYVVSNQCDRNCSFSSGDVAAAFFFLAVARALIRRRRALALIAAAAFGLLVTASRIVVGAHFLSDAVVSFFVMLLLTEALHPPDRKVPVNPDD